MRESFREWYPPTPQDLERLWNEAIVVLDSSVLLGLYQYPQSTLDGFFEVLIALGDRLWIPHQVGLEFQQAREGRIRERRNVLVDLQKRIEDIVGTLDRLGLPEYHPVLDKAEFERLRKAVEEALDTLLEYVATTISSIPEKPPGGAVQDDLFERITSLFDGKVGARFSQEELAKVYEEGARRYEMQIPPGFKDLEKEAPRRYGDLVVWKQILREARGDEGAQPRPALLVTAEGKTDWWRRREEAYVGPRTELIREYLDVVGDSFHMYRPDQFLEDARTYLKLDVSLETIEDARRISEHTPVLEILRTQRMILPDPPARAAALRQIYDRTVDKTVQSANDLNRAIRRLGPSFVDGYVAVPLFFALISETYGPMRVKADASRRLRDRPIDIVEGVGSRESFVAMGHAAWLAQALYRLRFERIADDDLLDAFFGDADQAEGQIVLHQAQEFLDRQLG